MLIVNVNNCPDSWICPTELPPDEGILNSSHSEAGKQSSCINIYCVATLNIKSLISAASENPVNGVIKLNFSIKNLHFTFGEP